MSETHEKIRKQLERPFAAHETWWHRVAEQLLDENKVMREALWEFGDHGFECGGYRVDNPHGIDRGPCTCGLEKLRANPEEPEL